MYVLQFNHLDVENDWEWFQSLPITNKLSVNIPVQVCDN